MHLIRKVEVRHKRDGDPVAPQTCGNKDEVLRRPAVGSGPSGEADGEILADVETPDRPFTLRSTAMGVRLHELVTSTQQPKQRGGLLAISGNARPSNRAEIIIGRSLACLRASRRRVASLINLYTCPDRVRVLRYGLRRRPQHPNSPVARSCCGYHRALRHESQQNPKNTGATLSGFNRNICG